MILELLATMGWACGPGFPQRLLDDRAATLLELPEGIFLSEAGRLIPAPADPLVVDERGDQALREREGLTDAQWTSVVAMRAAPDAARAWVLGDGLPAELRLYTAGAVAWHHDDRATASQRFLAVLALPEPERRLRGVWAAYDLASDGGWEPGWAGVRDLARAGSADPAGLAVASLGEEARTHLWEGRVGPAVALYAAQAARGSVSGASSLLRVARAVATDAELRREAMDDPLVRRLMVVYAWTRGDELDRSPMASWRPEADGLTVDQLLEALEQHGVVDGADQAAALAYDRGKYPLAARWAALSTEPLASWVRAKLALREGRLDDAATAYADAARSFPPWVDHDDQERVFSQCRLHEERGALALARGEYVEALDVLLVATRRAEGDRWHPVAWEDAAYVAERVLTVDELRRYVDRSTSDDPVAQRLRALLARRLVREQRVRDAIPYFDDAELRAQADAYADALARSTRGSPIHRARGLLEASHLARPGLYLLGTEVHPDYAVFDGSYERDPPPAGDVRYLGADEPHRVEASAPDPDQRWHYRQVAKDLAVAAADLLPTTSQAYAVALCDAGSYVAAREPEQLDALWQRYVATGPALSEPMLFGWECPEPDWDGAERRAGQDRPRIGRVMGALGVASLGLALVAWAFRRLR